MANGTNKGGKQRHEDTILPTFTCVICGEEVSKRKSLAVLDGRACRSHKRELAMIERMEKVNQARSRAKLPPVTLEEVAA